VNDFLIRWIGAIAGWIVLGAVCLVAVLIGLFSAARAAFRWHQRRRA
jgi:hypothetical protein